jgi:hypothetical protein
MTEVEAARSDLRRRLEECLDAADALDHPGLAAKVAEALDWLDRYT